MTEQNWKSPSWIAALGAVLAVSALDAQTKTFALNSAQGLELHNVKAEPVTYKDKKGLRITMSDEAAEMQRQAVARRKAAPKAEKKAGRPEGRTIEFLAGLTGSDFHDGVIEVDLAGEPAADAGPEARGFVGIAFRGSPEDKEKFECFYLRPTNGRADDQERRNHSAQYISHPEYPWFRLRNETPSRYEAYVDLVPGEWTKVRIEVRGDKARLYVHGNDQPTLIVNDLKHGADANGRIGLWIDVGTVAYFADLRVSP